MGVVYGHPSLGLDDDEDHDDDEEEEEEEEEDDDGDDSHVLLEWLEDGLGCVNACGSPGNGDHLVVGDGDRHLPVKDV
jgi:hypothetical protein